MNRILLITTGGTLACTPTPKGLAPTLKGRDILAYSAWPQADISVMDFRLIDSSVMTDEDRRQLAKIIFDSRDRYDSFIVTHGTDSMAYTAAYLDCALPGLGRSVILTGSQLPLPREGTDAVDNLNLAIKTAMEGCWGVCMAIHHRILPARTATKTQTEGFTAFECVDGVYPDSPGQPRTQRPAQLLRPKYKTGLIYITPNLDRQTIAGYSHCDCVIALVLGAGGMPRHQEAAFDRLKAGGVKVYIKSQCLQGRVEALYEAHSGVGKFIPINDCSVDWAVYAVMFGLI